jgi:hypothetical protein
LTAQAKQFQTTTSELRDSINRFIRYIGLAIIPIGALLTWSQLQADQTLDEAIRGAIAGVVTMIPEGLVLLTSIAMAVGVLRLAQRNALVQDMPAVETLARVDVVCVDKTGTLTAPGMTVREVVALEAAGARPGPGGARHGRGQPEPDDDRPGGTLSRRIAPHGFGALLIGPEVVGRARRGHLVGDRRTGRHRRIRGHLRMVGHRGPGPAAGPQRDRRDRGQPACRRALRWR